MDCLIFIVSTMLFKLPERVRIVFFILLYVRRAAWQGYDVMMYLTRLGKAGVLGVHSDILLVDLRIHH